MLGYAVGLSEVLVLATISQDCLPRVPGNCISWLRLTIHLRAGEIPKDNLTKNFSYSMFFIEVLIENLFNKNCWIFW